MEAQLLARGHRVVDRIMAHGNATHQPLAKVLASQNIDVAIEFSVPEAAESNVRTLLKSQVPVVSGTTGWQPELLSPLAEQYEPQPPCTLPTSRSGSP